MDVYIHMHVQVYVLAYMNTYTGAYVYMQNCMLACIYTDTQTLHRLSMNEYTYPDCMYMYMYM